MKAGRIRVGIIGAGRIAGFVHLPSLRLCGELCEVVAVASRDVDKARAFAARWEIPRVHETWQALVNDSAIDAVVICPPSDLNLPVASAAIVAGKHILCEKPLAITFPDARALCEAAERTGQTHMVAFTFRFAPALRYLKRLVAEGHFDEIRHWRMAYFTDAQLDPRAPWTWRHERRRGGAGILADMGSHMVDLARYLLGDIVAVSGASRTYVPERPLPSGAGTGRVETPDACAFAAEFESGVIGTFDMSRAVAGRGGTGGPNYQAVEIHGTGGAALYELIHPFHLQVSLGPAMARRQHWATIEVPGDLLAYPGSPRNPRTDDPLVGYKYDQGVAFLRAIRGETSDYPTFHDGAEAQRVVDAVDAAIGERRWLAVARR
ncbi:MAG: Gfo/Idh/MocA family oxidoreductase [Candidatus Rokubacteria bacterium]|nr:Gfo/Idh/MocA family oxidoreductase [Candidatus Rokubacteria bacterium]